MAKPLNKLGLNLGTGLGVKVNFYFPNHYFLVMRYAPRALWLAAPALTALSLLASCSDQPKTTDTEKTAVVVPSEATSASDSAAATVDSTKMKTDSTKMK